MARVRCFMIEPTDRVRRSIDVRTCTCETCRVRGSTLFCPSTGEGHRARVELPETIEPLTEGDEYPHTDLRDDSLPWPTRCDACGAEIPSDRWLRGAGGSRVWRNVETGEEYPSTYAAGPGAMYRSAWQAKFHMSADDGLPLVVVTPGGEWCIDSQASNCGWPDDRRQERHHCWERSGTPPNVTVRRGPPTCGGGGAGSIQCGTYHGFLTNGYLED